MNLKKKKVAIIGCGYWGTNIIKTLQSFKNLDLICYDTNHSNLINIKKKFSKVSIIKNLKLILKDKNIKLVFICITTSQIFSVAKQCIVNNKNVFLEKPVSTNYKKISQLYNLSKKKEVRMMVGYVYIYNNFINL